MQSVRSVVLTPTYKYKSFDLTFPMCMIPPSLKLNEQIICICKHHLVFTKTNINLEQRMITLTK